MKLEDFLHRSAVLPETKLQLALLQRITVIIQDSPACIGAVLLGSFAKGIADRVSDLDLVIFCNDDTGNDVLASIRAQIPAAEVFNEFNGSHGPGSPFVELILYDFTSIEIHAIAPATKFAVRRPFVEIVNRERCLESRLSEKPAPSRDVLVPYRHGPQWLSLELFNCMKWLSRGQTEEAKQYLVRLGKAIEESDVNGSPPRAL
ncbi:MAG: nucleotidyltransferase domain-containing protein [Rhodoferax sp.]|nr:nucleotidyltransferase domain-containing protein [Rhodoferax sp.]